MIDKRYLYSTVKNGKVRVKSINHLSLLLSKRLPFTNVYKALSGKRRGHLIRVRVNAKRKQQP